MALPITYFLTDCDGTLCVAARSASWSEPVYIVNHFPTVRTTASFCREWEIKPEDLREAFTVKQTMPGEFRIEQVATRYMRIISLPEGAKTGAICSTREPVPVPRVGKGTRREWENGRWRIVPPKGKPRIVEV